MLFSNALAQLSQKENERQMVENLFKRIIAEGYAISLGEPTIHARADNKNAVGLSVPVTIKVTESITRAIAQTARSLGSLRSFRSSIVRFNFNDRSAPGAAPLRGISLRMGNDLDTVAYFQKRIANLVFVMEARLTDKSVVGCHVAPRHSEHMMGGYVGALGIDPVQVYNASSENREISGFGSSGFYTGSDVPKLNDGDGFIAILEEPVSFTLETKLPLDEARQIRSLLGKIVEGKRSSDYSPSTAGEHPACSVAK
jgi:hypothetical protein